ncbi:MAG TPA: SDR family oxidoreductase [Caldimonas sp.]
MPNSPRGSSGARRQAAGPNRHEIAGTAVFLASPAARFVTGQILYVDGGFTAAM